MIILINLTVVMILIVVVVIVATVVTAILSTRWVWKVLRRHRGTDVAQSIHQDPLAACRDRGNSLHLQIL